jgi:glucose-1-phosphate thymidylyltransferase
LQLVKAIILAAGAGTKLRPITYTQPKSLIPIGGTTILGFIIDQLIQAGVNEYIFVIGYLGEKIKDYVTAEFPHIHAHFIYQQERRGTGHAVLLTKDLVGPNEDVLIVLGDTITNLDFKTIINGAHSSIAIKKVDDPRAFGVANIDEHNRITEVIEKPVFPKSNLAMVGVYFIKESQALYQQLMKGMEIHNGSNAEYHLTSGINALIQEDYAHIEAIKVDNWFDCGKKETVLETNAQLLKQKNKNESIEPYYLGTSIIIPPVSIGEGCDIQHSIVGPNVSIGENSNIQYSMIKNTIIGAYTNILDILLKDSIIGSDASIKGSSQSLNIGDNTEIDFN